MSATNSNPIRLFSPDLDGTLVGNAEASQRFKSTWERIPVRHRPLLVYNSGRLVDDMRRFIIDDILPTSDYYIGGVGTQIYDERGQHMIEEFYLHLSDHWNLACVQEIAASFP